MEFTPQQQHSLLTKMGYTGPVDPKMMEAFLSSNPGASAKMGKFSRAMQKGFATGGLTTSFPTSSTFNFGVPTVGVRSGSTTGGVVPEVDISRPVVDSTNPAIEEPVTPSPGSIITEQLIQDPSKLTVAPKVAQITEAPGTIIEEGVGQAAATGPAAVSRAPDAQTAQMPIPTPTSLIEAASSAPQVSEVVEGIKDVQGQVSPEAQVVAAQQTKSSIEGMQAAQGEAILMTNPMQRELQAGEIVSGSAVDAAKVEKMMESLQAAEATPSKQATVQGQLEELLKQFEDGQTPAWAAGAMRAAQATLAQRGLGASSIAGQAIIQAAMESALPIAQIDANTRAQFEAQNLSNRQQTALFAAQQRAQFLGQEFDQNFQTRVLNAAKVSDIANMNFTAEQNIALENSRIVNTVNLANLGNRQAMILAQAAALSNLDIANLNNRQQAAVQNAQNFLQMDLANLSNAQQTELFRAQSLIQSLFTDQAAENAARQFNAASTNQTNQFFADLGVRVSQFNAEQVNAISQFNAGQANAAELFNKQLEAARNQFNAQNSLIIAQANAQWRQNLNTLNTAAQNEANMELARTENAMTLKAMDELWQKERDLLNFAFLSYEKQEDRFLEMALADKKLDLEKYRQDQENSRQAGAGIAGIFGSILGSIFGKK
jgi:hypothetical protein